MKNSLFAQEVPVELRTNGNRIASFLCTPKDLEDLAVGHLLTRGLIPEYGEVKNCVVNLEQGFVDVQTAHAVGKELYSVPEFVICGNSTVSNFNENINRLSPISDGFVTTISEMKKLARTMVQSGELYHSVGGVHAGAIQYQDDLYVREDIGRHSAVDKVIGAAAGKVNFSRSVLCTTGRISLDMLLKSAAVGIPIIVSLKVVSSLAVELAEKYNITIVSHILHEEPDVITASQRIVE